MRRLKTWGETFRRSALLLLFGAFASGAASAANLTIFAAASLSDVLTNLATAYEKTTADKLSFNLGASSALARQILEGAPADLFFSADEEKMDSLEKGGAIFAETRTNLLSNKLAVVIESIGDFTINSARDLAGPRLKHLALAEPNTVPAGIYAKQYLEKAGLWELVKDRVVPVENVRAALAAVESGNAEAAIVYKTDALISKTVRIALEISDGPAIHYPIAVIKTSKNPEAARKLIRFLSAQEAKQIFQKYGFLIPTSLAP